MRHLLYFCWLCSFGALLVNPAVGSPVGSPATAATAAAQPLKTWGYQVWWMPDAWRSLPLAELDRLIFFELKANAQGAIDERQGWPEQWLPLRQALAKHGTPLELALSILDTPTFMALFQNPQAINQLQTDALALAAQEGVAGLHLDFEVYETIPPATLQAMRLFVQKLSQNLKDLKPARSLSVFYPVGSEVPMYDAPTLASIAQVVVQGYDAHWLEAPTAGPVAPLRGPEAVTWEKALAQLLAMGVPRQNLLFSFPLYGYEWPLKPTMPLAPMKGMKPLMSMKPPMKAMQAASPKPGGATQGKGSNATFAPVSVDLLPDVQINIQNRVQEYGATHEPVSASSYYQYKRADGQWFEGWFEDWWSLERKSEFLQAEKLNGIAFFPLGYDQDQLLGYFLLRQRRLRAAAEAALSPPLNPALPTTDALPKLAPGLPPTAPQPVCCQK